MAYYKIEKGTETFDKMVAVRSRMAETRTEAKKLLESIPNSLETYYEAGEIAGGIYLVGFDGLDSVPDNWVINDRYTGAGKAGARYARPHKKSKHVKEIRKKIQSLPTVSYSDFNSPIGYSWITNGRTLSFAPGVMYGDDVILLNVADADDDHEAYTPPNSDIIEIKASEYYSIKEALEELQTQKA